MLVRRKINEYKDEVCNKGSATNTIYEFPGTSRERAVILNSGEKAIIKIKDKPNREKVSESVEQTKQSKKEDVVKESEPIEKNRDDINTSHGKDKLW